VIGSDFFAREGPFRPPCSHAASAAGIARAGLDYRLARPRSRAQKHVCESLQLATRDDPLTEIVARKVIEIAGTGERDPARIRALTLLAFRDADERSA
jgi:hypothetical protein